ncbi:TPM domain-containing protein [Leptospira mtsangambouensis]|uniref:TPM domain-containing protein n=1 Tax=Leptospira mtsangambouensis TaxID=2484912 RepID=A0ABY2P1T8_9LEPT|nr:TPM domain-containing protein [Leptospira mtsangambouensis]TGM78326.1 TPM domain-containing protein [Leptospira mtsangambouensis]
MNLKIKLTIYVFFVIFFLFCQKKEEVDGTIYFSDKASVLNSDFVRKKNEYLKSLKQADNIDIRVLVIPSTGQFTIEDFSLAAFEQYKIGGDLNNGIFVLIATEDKKLRIATGTGIELIVPDDFASQIIKEMIVYLPRNDLENAVNVAINRLHEKAKSVPWTTESKNIEKITSDDLNKIFEIKGEYISKRKTLESFAVKYRTDYFANVKVKNKNVLVFENQYLKNMIKLEKSRKATMLVRLISLEPETYQLLNIK